MKKDERKRTNAKDPNNLELIGATKKNAKGQTAFVGVGDRKARKQKASGGKPSFLSIPKKSDTRVGDQNM